MRLSPAGEALLQREEGASYSPAKPWYIMSARCAQAGGAGRCGGSGAPLGRRGAGCVRPSVRSAPRVSPLRRRGCLCCWITARLLPFIPSRRRHWGRAARARGGVACPAPAARHPRGRSARRPPPPAAEESRDEGRGAVAGAGGAPRAARGGAAAGFPPPRGVVRPGSGTH